MKTSNQKPRFTLVISFMQRLTGISHTKAIEEPFQSKVKAKATWDEIKDDTVRYAWIYDHVLNTKTTLQKDKVLLEIIEESNGKII